METYLNEKKIRTKIKKIEQKLELKMYFNLIYIIGVTLMVNSFYL